MSTDESTPSEDDLRHAYRTTRLLDHHADVNAAFDRFLARVRREAQWEAWTDCVSEASAAGWLHPSTVADMLYRNPFKETP